MKRLTGLFLTLVGAALVLWGGFHVLLGQSDESLRVTDNFSLSAMVGGLAGVAIFTFGLIWVRD